MTKAGLAIDRDGHRIYRGDFVAAYDPKTGATIRDRGFVTVVRKRTVDVRWPGQETDTREIASEICVVPR